MYTIDSNTKDINLSKKQLNNEIVEKNILDKFYTNVETSTKYINKISNFYDWKTFDFIIEPSAGAGSFLFNIPSKNKIGIDIEPEHDIIKKQDFLHIYLP